MKNTLEIIARKLWDNKEDEEWEKLPFKKEKSKVDGKK